MLYGVYIFINLCCLGVEQINSFLFLVWRSSRRLLAEELKGGKFCGSEVDSGLRGNKISLRSWTDETRLSCFQQIHGCGARGGNISTISFFFFYLSETAELLQIALNCDRFRVCVTPSAVVSCLTETNWQAGCCPSISSKAQHTILLFYRNLLPIRFPQGWKDGRHRVIVLFVLYSKNMLYPIALHISAPLSKHVNPQDCNRPSGTPRFYSTSGARILDPKHFDIQHLWKRNHEGRVLTSARG